MTINNSHFCYTQSEFTNLRISTMQQQLSKTHFKAQALEIMRNIEESGEPVIITSHGKKSLILSPFKQVEQKPLEKLKGSVVSFDQPTQAVADDEWELA